MKTKEEIITLNKNQKEFYNTKKRNYITSLWSSIRGGLLTKIRKGTGIQEQTYAKHIEWLGDLSQKKVLDLGCFSGNHLSVYMAQNAKSYVGIDLSDKAITQLQNKLKDIPSAEAKAVDFLSDEDFPDTDFDVIYAYGVLHHFQNVDLLIDRLQEKLNTKGNIISYDPLETSIPIKIVRTLYRPFQSDKDWEWPFTKTTYSKFAKRFSIIERRGVLGKLKWIVLVNFLPLSAEKKKGMAQKWHQYDWDNSAQNDAVLFRCMHLTMLMQKK